MRSVFLPKSEQREWDNRRLFSKGKATDPLINAPKWWSKRYCAKREEEATVSSEIDVLWGGGRRKKALCSPFMCVGRDGLPVVDDTWGPRW